MRYPILLVIVMLSATAAWANELPPPEKTEVSAANTDAAQVDAPAVDTPLPDSEVATPVAEVSPAKPDCPPPPPPPPETDADRLNKVRGQIALQKIESFRAVVKDTSRNSGFFSSLFTTTVYPVDQDLLLNMDHFIIRHPDLPETAEVFYLKAQVHRRMEAYPAAAVDLLMLLAVYPDSVWHNEANKQLKELAADQLKKQAGTIKDLTQKARAVQGERDQRLAAFLADVGKTVNEPVFAPALIAESASFLMSNRNFLDEDVIEHALAKQAALTDDQIAIAHFNKLLLLYPDSPLRPDSLLSLANVQRKGLKQFDRAGKTYAQLIEQYPASPEAKSGHLALAKMYEEEVFNYPNALKAYDAIVAKYNDDPIVLLSLRAMAQIYQSRVSQPAKAVERHIRISETFKGKDALDALNTAEGIAVFTLRDWKTAMEINDRIIALVPGSNDAIKVLFANADITDANLKDKEQAKKRYAEVIAKHPEHTLAKEAQKRITAMESKKAD